MKVTWRPRAKRDLNLLIAYIAQDSIESAELVATRILRAAETLTIAPRAGRSGRINGTRELVVQRTAYILVYRVEDGRVRILRVYHAARKWPSQFE